MKTAPVLSKSLFWDTDPSKIDWERNAMAVISRVAHRGNLEEWKQVEHYYGKEKIKEALSKIRWQDPKAENFFKWYYDLR